MRDRDTEHFGAFKVYHELELGWLFDWKIRWFRALQNLVHVGGGAANQVIDVGP